MAGETGRNGPSTAEGPGGLRGIGARRRRRVRRVRPAAGRAAVAGLLATLALAGLPAAPGAEASEPASRGIDRVCPAPGEDRGTQDGTDAGGTGGTEAGDADAVDQDEAGEASNEERFPDIGTTHAAAIGCAVDYGLVSGFSDGTFQPNQGITRQQMGSFVAAWVQTALGLPLPVPDERRFDDVEDGVHADAIDALAEAGIIGGRADGSFGPTETLTRGQFTRAVANAISYADVLAVGGPLPPAGVDVAFTDVDGTTFEDTIRALAGIGVAVGTGEGAFEPRKAVTRGQLSTFLMRAADLLDEYQRWRPTALAPVALQAALVEVVVDEPADADAGGDTTAGDGTDGDGVDGGSEDGSTGGEGSEVTPDPTVVGELALVVDAFGAVLEFELTLQEPLGPYAPAEGLTLHLDDPDSDPGPVLQLATGESLDAVITGAVTGTVFEAGSSVRFVRLLRELDEVYVQLATAAEPDGVARGQLEPAPQ